MRLSRCGLIECACEGESPSFETRRCTSSLRFAQMRVTFALARVALALAFASLQPKADSCTDAQAECAGWAAGGECEKNPTFMLTSCADSCTRCNEGPEGIGKPRSRGEILARKDSWCGNLDDNCNERAAAGDCHNGTDAPIRCAGACRICGFPQVAIDAYGCGDEKERGKFRMFSGWTQANCERKRKRCARPPGLPPAVTSGGITRTMQRILSDFPEYSPRALSQPGGKHGAEAPWVVTLQNFVSDEEAQAFIDGCSSHFDRSLAGDQLSPVRTSSQCWCDHNACAASPLTQAVARRIANLTNVPDMNQNYFEPFQILKYLPGQFYKVHHDQNSGLFTPQGARLYTFFMYLSTPEAGGGTRFADLKETVPAVKGSVVLWPSVMDSDPDVDEPMTHHEGLPPERGIKYAANVWVHVYDYKSPASQGCPMSFRNTH